jgi:2,4-dienoyl-CoA reductase-like NADH-dependent reductase (Old Yellow Enzyme family)
MAGRTGDEQYPNVFTPIKLGNIEIPNRIYMAPHRIPLDVATPGIDAAGPAATRINYFAERAAGGMGLIIHSTQIAPGPIQSNLAESIAIAEHMPSYRRVTEAVHAHGAKIMCEI